MIQYTTPLQRVLIPGKDLTGYDVYITYADRWRENVVTIDSPSMEVMANGTTLIYRLTQDQTALFNKDQEVEIQVNWIKNGVRGATAKQFISIEENLLKEVIQ